MIGANTTQEATEVKVEAPSTVSAFAILVGQWVRPDGGYRITIRGVDADGRLDAAYANPPLCRLQKPRPPGTAIRSKSSWSCARRLQRVYLQSHL